MGVVVEGAGDEDIEAEIPGLARGLHQIRAGDGAELRADVDAGALDRGVRGIALGVAAFPADHLGAGKGGDGAEGEAVFLVRLLNSGGFQVLQDDGGEVLLLVVGAGAAAQFPAIHHLVVLIHGEETVRGDGLHGEGAGDADFLGVLVGLVVEKFGLGLGGDGGVDLLLAGDALFPPIF